MSEQLSNTKPDIDDSTKEGVAKRLFDSDNGSETMNFLFGSQDYPTDSWMQLDSMTNSSRDNLLDSHSHPRPDMKREDLVSVPTSVTKAEAFPLRKWELLPDAAPNPNTNDAALSLKLFAARKL